METFGNLKNAYLSLKNAEHILNKTYKITKNERLLLSVVLRIYDSMIYLSEQIILDLGLVDEIQDKIEFLKTTEIVKENEIQSFLDEIKNIVAGHEKSPVEFTRDNSFVICSDDYDMRKISVGDVETFISYANLLVEIEAGRVTVQNE